MKNLMFICIVMSSISGAAQVNLDSLWNVWDDENQSDTNRLKAINSISRGGYLHTQPDSGYYFAQMQYDFALKNGNKEYQAKAFRTQGVSFALRSEHPQAIEKYNKGLTIFQEIGNKKGIARSLNNIGSSYKSLNNYPKALTIYSKSLKISEEIRDTAGMSALLSNMGTIYYSQGDFAQAIEHYSRSLRIDEERGDVKSQASDLNNIGVIYSAMGDDAKAIEFQAKSIKLQRETGHKRGLAAALTSLGNTCLKQNDFDQALNCYQESLSIFQEIGFKSGIATSLLNIGGVYEALGNHEMALDNIQQSLTIYDEIGNRKGQSISLQNIGKIYKNQGRFLQAKEYLTKALLQAQEIGAALQIRNASEGLWKVNQELGNCDESLAMFEQFIAIRDSIQSEKNQKEIIRQEYKYQYEKQAAADSIRAAEANKVKDAQLVAEKAKTKQQQQQKYFLYGGLILALLFGGFIFNRFRITSKQKGIIEEKKEEVDQAYDALEEKNQEIMDSINYAKRIQSAILPPPSMVKQHLKDSFILYKPKDIVAGDFYWMEPTKKGVLFAAADCTGHGVPGAMVSVVCNNGLNRSVREHGLTDPGEILDQAREIVIGEFEKSEDEVKDGMDIALCYLEGTTLKYAGANNPLWIVRDSELLETKADKQPIGTYDTPTPFTTHTTELKKGDTLYIFSDGYADQFGGIKGKKFKAKALKELLLSIQDRSMEEQKQTMDDRFESWKGDLEQIDDVCVMGIRV